MPKLWAGITDGTVNAAAEAFNASIRFDSRMAEEDITGSMAHALMLGRCGIITVEEAETLRSGLQALLEDIRSGKLEIDMGCEDIHTFVEQVLTERLGDVGKKLHTARSRNDQVALDLRLYLRKEADTVSGQLTDLLRVLVKQAEANLGNIMPGYTHLQRAQPVSMGQHLMAYAMMFLRDRERLADCRKRINCSPIGSCALAGTTYATDRRFEAAELGFDGISLNSMDGVSDRDFVLELLSVLSIIMMHLSRFSEELVLWSSWEFGFVKLGKDYTTGSSIMPQKVNPDMAELVRGKTGRVYGHLMALLTTMKGLPLAYNKDMQEDKEGIFDACDTVEACLEVFTGMLDTMTTRPERMLRAAGEGFINATDLADYLVRKGLPFRSAYKLTGELVRYCMEERLTLEKLPLDKYREYSELFDEELYEAIDLKVCAEKRISEGGTSSESVKKQIEAVRRLIEA